MTITKDVVTTQLLSLPEELILMLLNEESGYFHQVSGWDLNCAVIGCDFHGVGIASHTEVDDAVHIGYAAQPDGVARS